MSNLRKKSADAADDLAENGQRLYDERQRSLLEPGHEGEFVAINPDTERHFFGQTGLTAPTSEPFKVSDRGGGILLHGPDEVNQRQIPAKGECAESFTGDWPVRV
jgi:hypothetical protein